MNIKFSLRFKTLLYLYIFVPIIASQTVEDYLNVFEALAKNVEDYQFPENYEEFDFPNKTYEGFYGDYDFIIVGAGSAGTVLANRLSEIKDWKILLLEAGQNETVYTDVPGLPMFWQFTNYNWGYKSIPQKNCCLGMVNNQCNLPRGKALGGSSVINYMIYTRGNKEDYDKWAAQGNPGWSYEKVLPYFKKSEKSYLKDNVDESYHGKNGTLSVEHVRYFTKTGQVFLEGVKEFGRKILDYNGKDQMGYSRLQSNTINGRRCSGNKAFLSPILGRENIQVQKAFVTKLYVNASLKAVEGVEFLVGPKKYYAIANKEVILSAGAIGSPQILMHSGIGPKNHLESLGIKVVQNLAVGQNLGDHPFIHYPVKTSCSRNESRDLRQNIEEYLNGSGVLTTAGNMQALGYINSANQSAKHPDVEHLLTGHFDLTTNILQKAFNYKPDIYDTYFKPYRSESVLLASILLHPKSRGRITLKSANPFDHPLIDLNYFSDPDDVKVLAKGLKDFIEITKTKVMQKCNIEILNNQYKQCPQEFLSDDYLRCHVRHMATTLYHQSGTCKMGPEDDPEAVVDSRLKVRNVNKLRVIDASVIPFPLAAHTNAPTYMIAEKGADLIKQDWNVINNI